MCKSYKTFLLVIFNVVVIPISIFLSRYLVSTSIGLPPQDYDLTILAITPLLYVYVACFFIALIQLIVLALEACLYFFRDFIFQSWLTIFTILSGTILFGAFLIESELFTYLSNPESPLTHALTLSSVAIVGMLLDSYHPLKTNKTHFYREFKYYLRKVSILAVCLFMLDTLEKTFFTHFPIKLTAYYLDYFELPQYPNLKPHQKVLIHENGVISYAIKNGSDVQISIDKYD